MGDRSESRVTSTLRRLATANQPQVRGEGMQPGDYILLCKYHNRCVASELQQRLEEDGIRAKTKTTRMYVSFFVTFENREKALQILDDFAESHVDTRPRRVSRDYDLVFLVGFVTMVVAAFSFFSSTFTRLAPVAVLMTGISLSIVIERWHRQYRYQEGTHFTLRELFGLTTLFAANLAIWRLALPW